MFVGHQAKGTLGRRILDGEREVRIHGRTRRVYARIEQVDGLSAHADRNGLIDWLSHFETPPRRLFLTHGEEESSLALARMIRDRLGWEASVPEYGSAVDLSDEPVERTVQIAEPRPEFEAAVEAAPSTVALQTPDFEFLDSTARPGTGFLYEDPWRVFRMQSDTIQGIELMARALQSRRRSIAVFGSARLPESDPVYALTRETCRRLGESGFATITGGGPGVMEAANRGARDAGALSIGLNIDLPHEQKLNDYCDVSYMCRYFFVRKMLFAKYARAFLIFAGGYGTLDELFEALTLIQTERLAGFPVILVGSEYWEPLVSWLRSTMYASGCISETDLSRFVVLDSPEDVVATLEACISDNGNQSADAED